MNADRSRRRRIGAIALLVALGLVAALIPRLGVRSPIVILVLCALAVLTMKLVEHRVHQWFQRWAERQARTATKGPK